ncbi:hypermethylated in cancer 2 protein [Sminthopsis crassicaudata]|uniref:hypermethylated in cancer 2 protein n=1 Tax=Sminthopsis crassicaudata TaxID=9301 RepID=UPI003D69E6A6
MELPNHSKQLLLQLNQQRAKGFLCDVIIVVENALFRAHKNVLAASSMYFKSLVLHDNLIHLDTDMVSPTVFRQVLDFIYTGKVLPGEQPAEPNFGTLLTAASYLQLPELAALCRRKLKRAGKPYGSGRAGVPGVGRPARGQRLAAASVIQARYPPAPEARKPAHPPKELPQAKGSDDELYLGAPGQENPRPLSRMSCKNGGDGAGCGGSGGNSGGSEQELGLDLSKKSPTLQPPAPGPLLGPEDLAQLSDSQHGSPAPASANSASYPEPAGPPEDPMEVEAAGAPEENHLGLLEGPGGQPRKSLRHLTRKKEWSKTEAVACASFERKEAGDEEEPEDGLPNGILGASGAGPYGEPPFACKEEMENGKELSEESGQSEAEGGGAAGGAGGAPNYVYRQEGFEAVPYGDNLYVCIPCGKGFPSSEQLNAHVETHTEEELFIKEEAGYGAPDEEAEDLSAPSPAYASEQRPFKCSGCDKSYKDPATLRQHEKTHWLTRPFPCNICGKMFTQRGTMTRHMRSHLGLKPFACEECGMRFTRQYRLTEHMRVHSGEKPYECHLCGGKFTQQRNLISHLRMHTSPS